MQRRILKHMTSNWPHTRLCHVHWLFTSRLDTFDFDVSNNAF